MTTRIPTTASSVRRVAAVAVMGAFALSACTAAPDTASPAASTPAVADAASGDTDGAEGLPSESTRAVTPEDVMLPERDETADGVGETGEDSVANVAEATPEVDDAASGDVDVAAPPDEAIAAEGEWGGAETDDPTAVVDPVEVEAAGHTIAEPESEPVTTTTAAPEPEPVTTTTAAPEPEPEQPEPELEPTPEPEPEQPEPEPEPEASLPDCVPRTVLGDC